MTKALLATEISIVAFGSAVLDECLLKAGLGTDNCTIGKTFNIERGAPLRCREGGEDLECRLCEHFRDRVNSPICILRESSALFSIADAPKLHEQLIQALDYLKQADTGECKVSVTLTEPLLVSAFIAS